jgi:hypothetical protein
LASGDCDVAAGDCASINVNPSTRTIADIAITNLNGAIFRDHIAIADFLLGRFLNGGILRSANSLSTQNAKTFWVRFGPEHFRRLSFIDNLNQTLRLTGIMQNFS